MLKRAYDILELESLYAKRHGQPLRCYYCGIYLLNARLAGEVNKLQWHTRDHAHPKSKLKKKLSPEEYQAKRKWIVDSCLQCNWAKGNRTFAQWHRGQAHKHGVDPKVFRFWGETQQQ